MRGGPRPRHGRGHVARAVLEAMAFAEADVFERLATLGIATGAVTLLGGGARSALWAQIRADVSGLPVDIAARADTCPLGAAMLAAVAAGLAADLHACAALVARRGATVDPAADRGAVDEAYARYRRLFGALRTLW